MCGIVGILGEQDESLVEAMSKLIYHRGPDSAGIYRDKEAALSLAMTRLAIVDISQGLQPMSTLDGRYTIVFNGEIFNAPSIRKELEKQGVSFVSDHSDTEVLLQVLIKWGKDGLTQLNGMFAFAFWDKHTKKLLCARDRFGIKPLYYTFKNGRFAFASELKSILILPWVERTINLKSIYHYLSLMYIPGEETAISGILRLSPGEWLQISVDKNEVRKGKWWKTEVGNLLKISRFEARLQIKEAMESAVLNWAYSDVPIACSLSGGLDSSAIVGILAKNGNKKLNTYSVGFVGQNESTWNELPLAKKVAEKWGTNHHEIILDPINLINDLLQMVWHLDEPYGGGLPSWLIFKEISKSFKVGVTGTGGDELFGNYGKWRELEGGFLGKFFKNKSVDKTRFRKDFFDKYYYFSDEAKQSLIFKDKSIEIDTSSWLYDTFLSDNEELSIRDRVAILDIATQLPEEFLMMTDRLSMAHSVEARTPFLDNNLANLVLGLPGQLRTSRLDLKSLLRESICDLLPKEVTNASKKGFVIPLQLWLRGPLKPLVELLLAPDRLIKQGIFKPQLYEYFVKPHLEGRRNFTQIIWASLMLQLWMIVFVEGNGEMPTFGVKDII